MSPKVITGEVFKNRKELGEEDYKDLIVDGGIEKIQTVLKEKWKYDGEDLLAVPSLTVNSMGKLSGARWYTMGKIPKEINLKLNQLFTEAEEDAYLSIKNVDTASFQFYNKRRNVSGWLDSTAMEHTVFRKAGTKKQVMTADKYEEVGMSGFCVRIGIMPISVSTATLTMAIFPLSKEELKAKAPESYIKNSCGQVALPIGEKNAKYIVVKMGVLEPTSAKVGMGIWPMIEDMRTEAETANIMPTSMEIRKGLHSFMRTCKGFNNKSARKVMESLEDATEHSKPFEPDFIWPEAAEVEGEEPVDELGEWHNYGTDNIHRYIRTHLIMD